MYNKIYLKIALGRYTYMNLATYITEVKEYARKTSIYRVFYIFGIHVIPILN